MKISICGVGFVGTAMLNSFLLKGFKIGKDLFLYDKFKNGGMGCFEDLLLSEIIFIALPTMYDENKKCYNKEAIKDTLASLKKNSYQGAVVIKCTVEPLTTENLSKTFDLNLIHNPEFLTARTAEEDFHNQKQIVLGKSSSCDINKFHLVKKFYEDNYPTAEISLCDSNESEAMKIFANSFYSTKIQFFNELYLLCQRTGINFNSTRDLMLKNGWINEMHTNVPGPDGKLSYGGLCFPKDTNALLNFMRLNGTPCNVLEAVITERNNMRKDTENIIHKSDRFKVLE